MKKSFLRACLVIALCILLAGCQCKHEWSDATCNSPKTCTKCGETEGDPTPHAWNNATCTAPKTCSACNATEGEPWGHKWSDATCTNPMVCSVCGEVSGEPLGHEWMDATCVDPIICKICGVTTGEALGHTITAWQTESESTCTVEGSETGICDICGESVTNALPLAEHTPGDWDVTIEPTEDKEGTRVKVCTVCGKELESEKFSLSAEEIEARYKEACKKISYKELSRSPDKYKGEYVKFTGYVVQVCYEAESAFYYSTYRVATSGKYDNVVYIYVDNYGSDERILEDDKITFYGTYDGLYSYTTVMGAGKTIPSIKVKYID